MKVPVEKTPCNVSCGLSTFSTDTAQKLADVTDPLHQLCKLHAEFHPTKEAKEAFHQIQQEFSRISNFHTSIPILIQLYKQIVPPEV